MEKFFLGMVAGIAALVGAALVADHFGYCPCSDVFKTVAFSDTEHDDEIKENAESAKETTENDHCTNS